MKLFTPELDILYVKKNGITYICSHYCGKVKIDSYENFSRGKRLNLYNVIINIKSVLNKDKDHNY